MLRDHDTIEREMREAISLFQQGEYASSCKRYTLAILLCEGISDHDLCLIRRAMNMSARPATGPLVHPRLGSLLDQRAACYERLRRTADALADARRLIEVEPLSCKGYMRAGKALRLQGHLREAHRVLQEGERIIAAGAKNGAMVSPRLFEALTAQVKAVQTALEAAPPAITTANAMLPSTRKRGQPSPPVVKKRTAARPETALGPVSPTSLVDSGKLLAGHQPPRCDPSVALPAELFKAILLHLPFSTILACHRVSAAWRGFVSSLPELFQNVTFRQAVTFKQMSLGMQRLVKANKHSHAKAVRMVKLRPHVQDEFACLQVLFTRVRLSYNGLNLGLSGTSLNTLLELVEKDPRNVAEVSRLRLLCPLDAGRDWKTFGLFPRLTTLELIPSKMGAPVAEGALELPESLPLQRLSLIHPPALSPHPSLPFQGLFRTHRFPHLVALTLVGYDFSRFRECSRVMFRSLGALVHLVLEENQGLNWDEFLQLFSASECRLESLCFREGKLDGTSHLRDFGPEAFRPFTKLRTLDVTGSSLSFQGLMKVLRNCRAVEVLYMGHCQHIWFKNGTFNQRSTTRFFDLSAVLNAIPHLRRLYLNQSSDLNDYALKQFHEGCKDHPLEVLDLSFNNITGVGLADLFAVSPTKAPVFRVGRLVIDACNVSLATARALEGKYCDLVQYQPLKVRWKEFGVNSYVPV